MNQFCYLLVNIGCVFVPLCCSFYPKHPFYKTWPRFFRVASVVAVFFLIWDEIFTRLSVWGFNDTYLLGLRLGKLPLEEILFFYCIPFACVFTYFALRYLLPQNPFKNIQQRLTLFFLLLSLLFIALSDGRLYPLVTGFFAALFFGWLYVTRAKMGYAYLTYFCIYPFFLTSNGILTGSGLESPVVWYDDTENFGLRVLTIPIEDHLYGLLLIVMNIRFFEPSKI